MDTAQLIQQYFTAWQERDWQALEALLTENFTFTSPYDDHITLQSYKKRCWDTVTHMGNYILEDISTEKTSGHVTYSNTINNAEVHNTEYFTFQNDKISSVNVYFGLPHHKNITPDPQLAFLSPLVGVWQLEGQEFDNSTHIAGQLTFEWMEGGKFLLQHVDIHYGSENFRGTHYIGYPTDWDGTQSAECISTFFDTAGNQYKYIWEFDGKQLRTLHGDNGAYGELNGTLSDDGKTLPIKVTWDGGGYDAKLTKQ